MVAEALASEKHVPPLLLADFVVLAGLGEEEQSGAVGGVLCDDDILRRLGKSTIRPPSSEAALLQLSFIIVSTPAKFIDCVE